MEYLILVLFLVLISISDFCYRKIPNRHLAVLLLLWISWLPSAQPAFKLISQQAFQSEAERILFFAVTGILRAAFVSGIVLAASFLSKKILKRGVLSAGDIKLIFTVSLFLTFSESLYMLLVSCLLGLLTFFVYAEEGHRGFPFGPAISLAAMLVLLVFRLTL